MSDGPNACRWCGTAERDHSVSYAEPVGFHGYTTPTNGQRLKRMHERRPEGQK